MPSFFDILFGFSLNLNIFIGSLGIPCLSRDRNKPERHAMSESMPFENPLRTEGHRIDPIKMKKKEA